jgi:pyruvate/2-oxoglutarate dehydrogenase complex dihydrolipoamide dehydrogenase (E3) component
MATENYQNLIIGSGESAKWLAWTLAKQGQKTVGVERRLIGGSCPNVACLPSKNVIFSAKVASIIHRAAEFGIATGPVKLDMAGVTRRKQNMVDSEREAHRNLYQANGAEIVMGEATFTEPKTVLVTLNAGGTRMLRGNRVFIAVGTRATIPNVPGLLDAKPMTHVEALDLQRLPQHLVILGGGYIGLEFAQALRRFGSRVTILHHGEHLLHGEDADVTDALLQLMKDEGIDVLLKTDLLKVTGCSGESVQLQVRNGTGTSTIEASDILAATGRIPNTDRLNLEKTGVELDSHGYIKVNEKLQTSAPDTWAMGDSAGSPQFTHVGFDDFRIVRDNLAGGNHTTTNRLIPYCLFTDPELAHVGITETQAKAKNIRYRLAKIPSAMVLRTHTTSENRGFIKALVGDDDRILGFTAFSAEASELLAAVQTAMLGGLPYTMLRDGIFAHPTMAEGLVVLFAKPPSPPITG